jgi:hypothetical protein
MIMGYNVYSAATERRPAACQEFGIGLALFEKRQWKAASRYFGLADRKSQRDDVRQHLYRSYHGLALLYCGDVSGLNLCRHAANVETIEAGVFLNLALAELKRNHRRRACEAVILGLQIDPRHVRLLELRRKMGIRRKPCVPFLRRDNLLNKWLGKATYRRLRQTSASR